MLIQLLPEQIPGYWPDIKSSIQAAVPPMLHNTEEKMNNLLLSMLSGRMQVWVIADQSDKGTIVQGIITTTILVDDCSGTRTLLFYSGYSIGNADQELWLEGMRVFNEFAKVKKCTLMGGYSQVPFLIEQLKKLGATEDTFLYWNVH